MIVVLSRPAGLAALTVERSMCSAMNKTIMRDNELFIAFLVVIQFKATIVRFDPSWCLICNWR